MRNHLFLGRILALCLLILTLYEAIGSESDKIGSQSTLFNGWGLTITGKTQIPIGDLSRKMILSPDGKKIIAVHNGVQKTGLSVIDIETASVADSITLPRCFNGIVLGKDQKEIFVTGGNSNVIYRFGFEDGRLKKMQDITLVIPGLDKDDMFLTGIAVHPDSGKLYVCNQAGHEVIIIDPVSSKLEQTIHAGMHPYTCVFGLDEAHHLYVSNWGSRSISVINTKLNKLEKELPVGIRPTDMLVSKDGRLFIACTGDNTVHVYKTGTVESAPAQSDESKSPELKQHEIINTSLYPSSPEGSSPIALTISEDQHALFVANADNNDVAVVDISNPETSLVKGFIPTAWYPSALLAVKETLYVANGKGGSRPNFPPKSQITRKVDKVKFDAAGSTFTPTISAINFPSPEELSNHTAQVRKNSPYTPDCLRRSPNPNNSIIPSEVGNECPIKYVLYIIKENRTYDQILGDLTDASGKPLGNGDPKIAMFGAKATPNQHKLAREYAVLDNLYCNGEVSLDGHSWCDYAFATEWRQAAWMIKSSRKGELPRNREILYPSAGAIWDQCKRMGLSYKCYGEGTWEIPSENRGKALRYEGTDRDSVQFWINDLHEHEQNNSMPRLTVMALPGDHTHGTTPGHFTPQAMVADNDLAVGLLVEAASKSKFWKEMAIFIIEDDAQNGPDHIDSHRTTGFVISPWCKRGIVDSTPYTTMSMLRTMELILGLPPLTQYDAGATPMFNLFSKEINLNGYQSVPALIDLNEKNKTNAPGAKESAAMNWNEVDEAPEDELNRILWSATMGPNIPYPVPIHRVIFFSP